MGNIKNNSIYCKIKNKTQLISLIYQTLLPFVNSRIKITYVFTTIASISFLIIFGYTNETNQESVSNTMIIFFGIAVCVTMTSLATYLYNDLYDIKSDSKNNRNVTLVSDTRFQYNVIFATSILFFISSIIIAFQLNLFSGIACLAFITLSVTYSHPATSFKDKFMIKTIVTAIGASLVSLIGIFAITESLETTDILLALFLPLLAFLFYFVLGPLGDIGDFKGDKHADKITIPIKIGIVNTFYLMYGVIFVIASMLAFLYITEYVHLITPIIGFCIFVLLILLLHNTKNNYNKQKIKQTRKYSRFCLLGILCTVLIGISV